MRHQRGAKWRFAFQEDDTGLPEAVPLRIPPLQAPGGVVLQFFDQDGELLAKAHRPEGFFGTPVDLVGVREQLQEAEDVYVVAFDGDDGERIASIELD